MEVGERCFKGFAVVWSRRLSGSCWGIVLPAIVGTVEGLVGSGPEVMWARGSRTVLCVQQIWEPLTHGTFPDNGNELGNIQG